MAILVFNEVLRDRSGSISNICRLMNVPPADAVQIVLALFAAEMADLMYSQVKPGLSAEEILGKLANVVVNDLKVIGASIDDDRARKQAAGQGGVRHQEPDGSGEHDVSRSEADTSGSVETDGGGAVPVAGDRTVN